MHRIFSYPSEQFFFSFAVATKKKKKRTIDFHSNDKNKIKNKNENYRMGSRKNHIIELSINSRYVFYFRRRTLNRLLRGFKRKKKDRLGKIAKEVLIRFRKIVLERK